MRRRRSPVRRTNRNGTPTSGTSMTASGRVSAARPMTPPRSAASSHERESHSRYAQSSISAINGTYIDSEMSMPSLIQSIGYTAPRKAASSIARGPAIRRATMPTNTMPPAPRTHEASRCASGVVPPNHDTTAR